MTDNEVAYDDVLAAYGSRAPCAGTVSARLTQIRGRRRELNNVISSPALQADARTGDQDARREIEAAQAEINAIDAEIADLDPLLKVAI